MQEPQWRLGDPCFIVDLSLNPGYVRMRIMPAAIINPPAGFARATNPPAIVGRWWTDGDAHPSEEAARAWIKNYVEEILTASRDVPLVGTRPEYQFPKSVPLPGQIIYILDEKTGEVLEVEANFFSLERGLEVGFSLRNCEAGGFAITEWWATKETALRDARKRWNKEPVFVSREDLERRADEAVEEMWRKAHENIHSPEFAESIQNLKFPAAQPIIQRE